jgi:membrane associated rhomboid family serine protease
MIPLRDDIPSRRFPVVNCILIAITGVVFFLQLSDGSASDIEERYGMVPARVVHPDRPVLVKELVRVRTIFGPQIVERERPLAAAPFAPWLTLLSCMFLHGGWLHFLGNVWFLYIFGDNVEDRLGRVGYLAFYLGTGIAAGLAHLVSDPESTIPTIGASGAIAGVMGCYFVLFPRARVVTLVPIIFFLQILVLPAPFFLGFWFLLQFFQGSLSVTSAAGGGVAWWAHIGGFAAGAMVALLLSARGRRRAAERDARQ